MTIKKIQINNYVFKLTIKDDNIVSGNFEYLKNKKRDMTKEELYKGQQILEDIFNGKYDNRIFKNRFLDYLN